MQRASRHTILGSHSPGWIELQSANQLDRETALRLWTESNTWFSTEVGKKGQIKVGQLADCAVLSADYFAVPENEIAGLDKPSLENLCIWIWGALVPRFAHLARVTVRRDSCGQSCSYNGR